MKKKIVFFAIFVLSVTASTDAKKLEQTNTNWQLMAQKQLAALQNFPSLSAQTRNQLLHQSLYWLQRIDSLRYSDLNNVLPKNLFQIPTALVFHTQRKDVIHMIPEYNVAYVPNLEMLYLIYYKYYQSLIKYGQDTPTPEVVMGILCRETKFTWVTGDNGQSVAPCQLHRATAKWLLEDRRMHKIFGHLIFFDKPNNQGKHHFTSNEAMIEFMYEFLVRTKGYKKGYELQGIARYNGCAPTDPYVKKVVENTIKYIALTQIFLHNSQFKPLPDKKMFETLLKKQLKAGFHHNNLEKEYVQKIINQTITTVYQTKELHFNAHVKKRLGENSQQFSLPQHLSYTVENINFGLPYIQKSPVIHLFAYFRGHTDTTIFYHNAIVSQLTGKQPDYSEAGHKDPDFIYVYYITANPLNGSVSRVYIRNAAHYRRAAAMFELHSQKLAGRVYVIPNFPVYYYQNIMGNADVPPYFIDNSRLAAQINRFGQ